MLLTLIYHNYTIKCVGASSARPWAANSRPYNYAMLNIIGEHTYEKILFNYIKFDNNF